MDGFDKVFFSVLLGLILIGLLLGASEIHQDLQSIDKHLIQLIEEKQQ